MVALLQLYYFQLLIYFFHHQPEFKVIIASVCGLASSGFLLSDPEVLINYLCLLFNSSAKSGDTCCWNYLAAILAQEIMFTC